jgi:recombination protein RecR
MIPQVIQNLIDKFSRFPGVGPKQAARFVFHLLRKEPESLESLTKELKLLSFAVSFCPVCFFPIDKTAKTCDICSDKSRNPKIICVVEKEMDLVALEKAGNYKGLYFVLGGLIDYYDKTSENQIRFKQLLERVKNAIEKNGKDIEVILALNSTTEGTTTSIFVEKMLRPLNVKISRLAQGLPRGAEMEYADSETLQNAMEGRRTI